MVQLILEKQLSAGSASDIEDKYGNIATPTLLLWGRQDKIVSLAVGKRLHQVIKNSQLLVIDKCGHAMPEKQPEQAAKAILQFTKSI